MRIDGRVALVTGAAGGIGGALARVLVRRGARAIVLTDVDAAGLDRVRDRLLDVGGAATADVSITTAVVDLTDGDALRALVATTEEHHGALDIVCSNAGIGTGEGADANVATWQRSWDVNVMAHVHAAAAALPGMLARGEGAFVHTCSAAGLLTLAGDAPYAVTKHAAVGFAEWLALTHGADGIRVVALCPLGVDTPLLASAADTLAGRIVRASGEVVTAEAAAECAVDALEQGRFLALPQAEVAHHEAAKVADRDRWLARAAAAVARLDRA